MSTSGRGNHCFFRKSTCAARHVRRPCGRWFRCRLVCWPQTASVFASPPFAGKGAIGHADAGQHIALAHAEMDAVRDSRTGGVDPERRRSGRTRRIQIDTARAGLAAAPTTPYDAARHRSCARARLVVAKSQSPTPLPAAAQAAGLTVQKSLVLVIVEARSTTRQTQVPPSRLSEGTSTAHTGTSSRRSCRRLHSAHSPQTQPSPTCDRHCCMSPKR